VATTYTEIKGYLDTIGVKYKVSDDGDFIRTGFKTKNYRDKDGDDGLAMVIRLREDGEYFEVFAPGAYQYKDGPHKLAVMQALMMTQWKTKLIQFEYDQNDGEIRPIIEFPLEDAPLGQRQFTRALSGLVQLVDDYHPVIQKAMETGQIEFPDAHGGNPLAELVGALGGATPEELQQLLEELRRRKGPPASGGDQGPDEL
jgi:hypothetical protein